MNGIIVDETSRDGTRKVLLYLFPAIYVEREMAVIGKVVDDDD